MNIHFIAIAGSAMHNLALALHQMGHKVTGSDDEITEPALSRLKNAGLLPDQTGWFPEKITNDLDGIILGMHARADNPELKEALSKGIKVYSYPEYLYEQSKDKTRVVIGGSHGKTTITSMVMFVLKFAGLDFDYMVGAQLDGFNTMVKLSAQAPIIILEGDEYLASPIDRRPKFHLYHPHIALISGIAWDHINVFPTFENYVEQFEIFAKQVSADGQLFFASNDHTLQKICESPDIKAQKKGYSIPEHEIKDGTTYLKTENGNFLPLQIFGDHNLQNLEGARMLCNAIGVTNDVFYEAIQSFKGAAKRLEKLGGNDQVSIFKDFAHSPSKLRATIAAVKKQFPAKKLIACMELHTFSSLNKDFLKEYQHAMDEADTAVVYYNSHTLEHKKLPPILPSQIYDAFARTDMLVFDSSPLLKNYLLEMQPQSIVILLMSSGTFGGLNLQEIANQILKEKSIAT
jgi:UDP-N-acetylmuramate: L-alanyl-gamma-D-glutamyl-meso-diaminopimelate ligase